MAAVLASTMIGAVSGPAAADADGTVVGRAAVRGNPLVPTVRDVPMAVTSDGTTLLAATTAGLTKYAVTRHSVKLLGTNRAVATGGSRDVEVLPNGRFAYVTYARPYPEKYSVIQVFNLRRDRPRLVRTMKFRSLGVIYDTVVSPDGRLFLGASDRIKVLDLTRPGHPTRAGSITEPQGAGVLAVTPDGSRLVTAPLVVPREDDDPVRVWDISSPEMTALEREGTVPVPQADGNGSWISALAVSPDGEGLYVESYYCDVECEDSYPSLARLRLSDLSTESRVERAWGTPFDFLAGPNPGGGKVFVRTGYTTDEPETKPRGLSWLDPDLSTHHEVAGVGNVRGVAVSPGGRTRGMVFAAGRKKGTLRIYAVRF
jgi:WD40 repeat protein